MIKKSIAILGGTFDPIHNAHLEIAHVLHDILTFQKVLFIPCKQNTLKENVRASAAERIEMIQQAIQPFSDYQCDLREIKRETPSYTIETLKSLRQNYPDDSLTFTMGIDSFNTLNQWEYFEEFLHYAHLLIFPRPDYVLNPAPAIQALVNSASTTDIAQLHQKKQGHIYFTNIPENSLSSTKIRALLENKDYSSVRQFLPESVFLFIKQNNLYCLNTLY